jgi:hypothetical protein
MIREEISSREAAILLMTIIENEGGRFELREDGTFRCHLDGVRDFKGHTPTTIAQAVMGFREDIRALLLAQRTRH